VEVAVGGKVKTEIPCGRELYTWDILPVVLARFRDYKLGSRKRRNLQHHNCGHLLGSSEHFPFTPNFSLLKARFHHRIGRCQEDNIACCGGGNAEEQYWALAVHAA
jgi:hypothetical protein